MRNFFYPRSIVQYAEFPEMNISWSNNEIDPTILDTPLYNLANPNTGAGNRNVITTTKPLMHVSNPTRGPKLDKTYYLKCTNFMASGLPDTITGITLTLTTQRNQKIVDDTICLIYNDEVISDNKTNLSAGPYSVDGHMNIQNIATYGDTDDLWGATITKEMIMDPSFGILLRFASNPMRPHKEGMLVYQITLNISPDIYFGIEPQDVAFITEDMRVFVPE